MENTNVQNEACANNCCHGGRWWILQKIRSVLVIILLLLAIAHLARGFFGHREFTGDRNGMMWCSSEWWCPMMNKMNMGYDKKDNKWFGNKMWGMMNKMMWNDNDNKMMTGSNMTGMMTGN